MIKGIDVSNWQGKIDFAKVKNAGYEIVYLKASQGEHTSDALFEQNYANAKANGMKIGVYHFLQGNESGVLQANFLYSKIKDKEIDCKIAIDVEVTNGASPKELSKIVSDFAEHIKSLTNLDVVVYTCSSFANDNLTNDLSKYPLWVAEYGVSEPKPTKVWGSNYIGWQYSEKGKIVGCPNGDTDLDYFTEDIYCKVITPPATSVETDKITLDTASLSANEIEVASIKIEDNKIPVSSSNFKIGQQVKVVGEKYATGETVPQWVKNNIYPIIQVENDKVLLGQGLDSWLKNEDVQPAEKQVFELGQYVEIIGQTYATGESIPTWVQGQVYPITQVGDDKVLLGNGLNSWVNISDVRLAIGGKIFEVGQKVRVIANVYSTGETIPSWVKEKTYTITQVENRKCLLGDGLTSWVNVDGLVHA